MYLSETTIRNFVIEFLKERNDGLDISGNINIMSSGIIDSIGFLELLSAIEDKFKIEIDFSELDPDEFTYLDNLSNRCKDLSLNR